MSKVLPATWDVPAVIRSRLGATAGKQRAMIHEGHLLLILHAVPRAHQSDREAALFWRKPDGSWKGAGAGRGGATAIRDLLDAYRKRIDELEVRVERGASAAEYFAVLQEAAPILRSGRNLHRALQSAREGIPDDTAIITMRDIASDIEREAELVSGDAQRALEFTIARRAEQQAALADRIAKAGHRLNLLGAMFFPVTAVGALFGMNLVHGLERAAVPYLFWAIAAGAFLLGFVVRATVAAAAPSPQ